MARVELSSGWLFEDGCLVDGWWGQFAPDAVVSLASRAGWVPEDEFWAQVARYSLARYHAVAYVDADTEMVAQEVLIWYNQHHADRVTDVWIVDEWAIELADRVEGWLNSQVPVGPDGDPLFVFEWVDGEFFLSPVEEGEELP